MTRSGEQHHNWKGGRYTDSRGYVQVRIAPGEYRREHRLVMERLLGRPLERHETVHHRNGDKQDNRPENLELLSNRDHVKLHWDTDGSVFRHIERGMAECHPDQPHHAKGLCRRCYLREAQRRYAERHPERIAAKRERDRLSGRNRKGKRA